MNISHSVPDDNVFNKQSQVWMQMRIMVPGIRKCWVSWTLYIASIFLKFFDLLFDILIYTLSQATGLDIGQRI